MLVSDPARLPGVRFEPEPPPPAQVLPRMDIAAFVGFAARGPLDTPIPVEDLQRFTEVFGDEVTLAWDGERGEAVRGQLHAAVHAFFRNGGRRCWIVRVAGPDATLGSFPIPGLLRCEPSVPGNSQPTLTNAFLQASSRGSWASGFIAAASVTTRTLKPATGAFFANDDALIQLPLLLAPEDDLAPGDVLRLVLPDAYVAFVPVTEVARDPAGLSAIITMDSGAWFRRTQPPIGEEGRVAYTDDHGQPHDEPARVPDDGQADPVLAATDEVAVEISSVAGAWPASGTLVQLTIGERRWWIDVHESGTVIDRSRDALERVRVMGQAFECTPPSVDALVESFRESGAPKSPPQIEPTIEVLRLTAWSGPDRHLEERRGDLGLAPGHPRFVGDLPTDEVVFGGDPTRPWTARREEPAVASSHSFPLAGPRGPRLRDVFDSDRDRAFYVPLALAEVPRWASGPSDDLRLPLERDGLARISPRDFLDPAIAELPPSRVIADADFIRYESSEPRPLCGIHALLGIDEVSLIAVPDAAQPHWTLGAPPPVQSAELPEQQVRDAVTFEPCDPWPPAVPEPVVLRDPDTVRSYSVIWPEVEGATSYVVEETREPQSWMPPAVTVELEASHRVIGAESGTNHYRVRAVGPYGSSDWSKDVRVVVDANPGYVVDDRVDRALALAVHVPLLRMCAARGDLFAILSVPEAVGPDGLLDHVADLRAAVTGVRSGAHFDVPAQDLDPSGVLSYGALYHPWLATIPDAATSGPGAIATRATGEIDTIRPTLAAVRDRPPDGAIGGVYAARATNRGAWVAPANVALRDVVAIIAEIAPARLVTLHGGGVNVVRRTPAGILTLASQTLSLDRTLREVNVRRLLSLLRRLAILHGTEYVFQPNSGAFRRRIQRGFEVILGGLYERGAFAGAQAQDGFRVAVGDPPNSVQALDAGQLIVELKVAPSVPLEFLTVRLVRSGERLAAEFA